MVRRPPPPRTAIDGEEEETVVLTAAEYDRLEASRRQVGAKGGRVRALTQQMQDMATLLARIEQVVVDLPDCGHPGDMSDTARECLRCRLLGLIRSKARAPEPVALHVAGQGA